MRISKWYSADIVINSTDDLNTAFEALSNFFALYDEITIHYEVEPDTDFCVSIEMESRIITWSNFNTNKHGEMQFEKLTSDILKEVFNNA